MQLKELLVTRSGEVVRRVNFKVGLNLILDKPTPSKTQSGNSVGKTTVLRLIDFCLGSDGNDIWQDPEFKKNINKEVYEFLHSNQKVIVSLLLFDKNRGPYTLSRSFGDDEESGIVYRINKAEYRSKKSYRSAVKELLFDVSGEKPTLRQLVPKFVRSSPFLMSKTLKFLNVFTSDAEYEPVHLFLFGFLDTAVLEDRPKLQLRKIEFERDWQALERIRTEGEIEQLLLHIRREIKEIESSRELRGEVPEIASRANAVSGIRAKAAEFAAVLSRIQGEISGIRMAIRTLESEYAHIDRQAVEAIYIEAEKFIPKLHHEWTDLADFVQSLRTRKQRFLESQMEDLRSRSAGLAEQLAKLQEEEAKELGTLVQSPEFNEALKLRSDLQEKFKKLGSLEQDSLDRKDLRMKLEKNQEELNRTREKIEEQKAALAHRVSVFNELFSRLSKALYGEEYLLYFTETDKGVLSFRLKAVGENVGGGKKVSQTAAFDLSYIAFLHKVGMNFPKFVCHDGVEAIHGNQLEALLAEANKVEGQLIIATLRDKLPPLDGKFLKENTVLELSQDDKFLRL